MVLSQIVHWKVLWGSQNDAFMALLQKLIFGTFIYHKNKWRKHPISSSVVFSWIWFDSIHKQIWKNQIDPDLKLT